MAPSEVARHIACAHAVRGANARGMQIHGWRGYDPPMLTGSGRRMAVLFALGGAALAAVVFARWDLRRSGAPRPLCRVAVPAFAVAGAGGSDRELAALAAGNPAAASDPRAAEDPGAAALADGLAAALAAQLGGIRGIDAAGPAELARGAREPFDLRLSGRFSAEGPWWEVEAAWLGRSGNVRRALHLASRHERIFVLQERLALSTAELCGIAPSFAERRALSRGLASSLTAYELYLRARALLDRTVRPRSGSAPAAATSLLRQATEYDPTFALAHATLAEALVAGGATSEAVHEAELARELDDHLPAIHLALVRADRAAGRTDAARLELRRLRSLRPEIVSR